MRQRKEERPWDEEGRIRRHPLRCTLLDGKSRTVQPDLGSRSWKAIVSFAIATKTAEALQLGLKVTSTVHKKNESMGSYSPLHLLAELAPQFPAVRVTGKVVRAPFRSPIALPTTSAGISYATLPALVSRAPDPRIDWRPNCLHTIQNHLAGDLLESSTEDFPSSFPRPTYCRTSSRFPNGRHA